MKVDLPNSSFYIGRFYLFLGEPYESLQAYAKAVASCSYCTRIQDEVHAIERICSTVSSNDLDGIEWIRRFLVISVIAKAKSQERMSYEEKLWDIVHRSKRKPKYQAPVVIVAGGCDKNLETNLEKDYGKLLKEAFQHFEGTVCGESVPQGA